MAPTIVKVDEVSLSTLHIAIGIAETDAVISWGSAFTYRKGSEIYLITNWHNVSGKNPLTGEFLSKSGAIPDVLVTFFRVKPLSGHLAKEVLPLYFDKEKLHPRWFIHPGFRQKVDVIALPLDKELVSKYALKPINEISFDDYELEVADEAFVIGYPFSDSAPQRLPIWKKASIASEPGLDMHSLPKLFLDTATRSGLSGSPVIGQRIGLHGMGHAGLTGSTIIGRIRRFIGIYSGRFGEDALKAQLGIVWKERAITELLEAKVLDCIHWPKD